MSEETKPQKTWNDVINETVRADLEKRPDLDAIEARVNVADAGPRRAQPHNRHWSTICADVPGIKSVVLAEVQNHKHLDKYQIEISDANAEFIAHAREDVPALLAYARALEAELEARQAREREAVELLRGISGTELIANAAIGAPGSICVVCGGFGRTEQGVTHADDCPVTRARAWLAQHD